MQPSNLFKSRGSGIMLLSAILLVFFLLKYPVLKTPFFWDEVGVYGSITFHLASTGPSLLPGAVDPWHSHGHPLLYPFVISIACKLFGVNLFVAHLANVCIALVMIAMIFIHVSQLYNQFTGAIASILLCLQPIFFAQAGLVLPEIALGLALWLSTWFYYKKKLLWYFLAGGAAVLIKEPAVVWIFTIALFDFFLSLHRLSWRSIQWLSPLAVFLLFTLKQKVTWGFYLFPYHSDSLNLNPLAVLDKLVYNLQFLFFNQGRWMILSILIIAFVSLTRYYKIRSLFNALANHHLFAVLGIVLGFTYILFCSLTFKGWRYLLPVIPFVTLFGSLALYHLQKYSPKVSIGAVALCVIVPLFYMKSRTFCYDNDMSYLRAIKAEQLALKYMVDNGIYAQGKFSANMPLLYATLDHRFGFLSDTLEPLSSSPISDSTRYAVAITPGTSLENPNNFPLTLVHEEYIHDIKLSVYRVEHDTIR